MGVINVQGYSVKIAGETPTPEEQERIDQYVQKQQEASEAFYRERFGSTQAAPTEEEVAPEDEGGFMSAVGVSIDNLQKAYGSALEGIGNVTGLKSLSDYGAEVVEANERQIEEGSRGFTQFDDAETIGDYGKFYAETLGQQAAPLGTTIGGSIAGGALAGSIFGPVGAGIGAIIGGALANIPYFYGDNREAQKEAMERGLRTEMDEGAAFLASIPQATLDSIADRFLIGKMLPTKLISSGGLFTRAVKGVGAGTVSEVPTEIGQEIINRYQAGLPIDDEEALKVYEQVAIAAGLTGGTVRGATNVIGGDLAAKEKRKQEEQDALEKAAQLQEDQEEEAAATSAKIERIKSEGSMAPTVDESSVEEELKLLPAPTERLSPQEEKTALGKAAREITLPFNPIKMESLPLSERNRIRRSRELQGRDGTEPVTLDELRRVIGEEAARREAVKQKPLSGGTARFAPIENKTFTQEQFDAAVQAIKALKRYTLPTISAALKRSGVKQVPRQMAMDVRDEMVSRGILKKSETSNTGYEVDQDIITSNDEFASYRRSVDEIRAAIEGNKKAKRAAEGEKQADFLRRKFGLRGYHRKLIEDARRAEQVENNVKKSRRILNEAKRIEADIATAEQNIAELEARIAEGRSTQGVPVVERVAPAVAPEASQAKIARTVARAALNEKRSDVFTQRQQNVFNALRKRLNRLNLPDVRLTAAKLLNPELMSEGAFVEGKFTVQDGNRLIALAMEAVDPNATAQEQFDVLKGIMNHEVIHALKNMGLFSDAEWNSLVKTASSKKYVAIKSGTPTERKYSYLERAQAMYSTSSQEIQEEEAVAELFRDYADNKISLAGKPRTLMERIKDFFVGLFKANQDAGIASVEDIFNDIRSGKFGLRERRFGDPNGDVEVEAQKFSVRQFTPSLQTAPDGARAHKLPTELLIEGNGSAPSVKITQKYTPSNALTNNSAIEQILEQHPNATDSVDNWISAMQDAFGGDYIPIPPMVAIEYSRSPEAMAEKLKQLTPELKKGVDEGFQHVENIRSIYQSGDATPRMTMDLFVWGILSRGAGPVQQEGAFIDVIDSAYPILEKATRQPLTDDDIDVWMNTVSTAIPEGSPGKQVTMNVNAAGKLVKAMSQMVEGTNRTVIDFVHEGMTNPSVSAAEVREVFLASTEGAGIDNKVLSFILLVGGKDDVLVMDRIQGRHLWDDGRHGGANIYDGIGPNGEGLNGIFRGPRGVLVTRMLENGMRKNIEKAYELAGRPEDASLGRWHWETWVIEGEQVVNHGTLQAVINGSPIGTSVTEGKTDTFSSGMTYIRGENAPVVEYPLSSGGAVYMSPTRFKEFTTALSNDAKKSKSSTGVFKDGKFKVTQRADIPWFMRPEVDQQALDALAKGYENAEPNGSILVGDARSRGGKDAARRGAANPERYSLGFLRRSKQDDSQRNNGVVDGVVSFRGRETRPVAKYGSTERPIYEVTDHNLFASMIKDAKRQLKNFGPQVTDYTEMGDTYEGKRLFLFDDGYSGFALNGNDIISVFSVPSMAPRGAVAELMPIAVEQGGERLDAFNTFLPKLYSNNGFRAIAKLPFNREYAPEGWNYDYFSEQFPETNGEPEVVFMVYDPENASAETDVLIDDYDVGSQMQEEALIGKPKKSEGIDSSERYSIAKATDSSVMFDDAALKDAANQNEGSREILSSMPIKDFLNLAEEGIDQQKTEGVKKLLAQGVPFKTVPYLYVENNGDGTGTVKGHEGRHRARALAELGYANMPVVIISQGGQGPSIRWGKQNDPTDFDYVDPSQRPKTLIGEALSMSAMLEKPVAMPDVSYGDSSAQRLSIKNIFDNFGEDGALSEFPDIGEGIDAYVYNNDRSGITRALRSENYPEYKRMLQDQLSKAYPSGSMSVSRTIGYADPFAEKTKTTRSISTDSVLLVGNPDERELIVNLDNKAVSVSVPLTEERLSVRYAKAPISAIGQQVQQKNYDQNYARAADFIGKAFRIAMKKDRAQEVADEILRRFQDAFLPVGRMIQELKAAGLTITDAMDTYLKEELYHRKTANELDKRQNGIYKNATEAAKKFNVTNSQIETLKKLSENASAAGQKGFVSQALETSGNRNLALADIYMYASHAKERNAYIKANVDKTNDAGSGMTNAEADAILSWFASLDPANRQAVSDFDAAIKAIVEDTNKVRVDGGLIPRDFVEIEDENGNLVPAPSYDNYVPLRGRFDPSNEQDNGPAYSGGASSKFGARGRPDKKALGRYDYATDLLATIINQNQNSVVRAEKNLVGQSFLSLLRSDTDKTKVYAEILDRMPTRRRAASNARVLTMPDFTAANDENIMVIKENGKDVYVEFNDTRIAKAMKGSTGLGAHSMNTITRGMSKVNRYLSNINTSFNPEFVVSNFLRDLQTAGINVNQYGEKGMVKDILSSIAPALKGIKKSIRDGDNSSDWAQVYQDFVDNGGKNATNQMDTIADQMTNLKNILADISDAGEQKKWGLVKNKFIGKGKSMLQFMEDYNTIVENGVRVATYKALLNRGFSKERAAQAAGNVTVNFSKGGEYRTMMNAWYLFYNASLQGSFALLNAALRSKKVQKLWAGVIAAGVLQDQLNAALSDDDDDGKKVYDKIPDYIKEHNLILPDPFGFTDRSYIAIPMPYGLNMAHNLGRAMSQYARGGADLSETGNSIVGTIVDTISPVGGIWTEGLENAIAPTIADPFIDIIGNEDFTGRNIYKENFPGSRTPDSQLYWSTTSPTAKWVAANLNALTGGTDAKSGLVDVHPDVLEFWFEYATGGIGRFAQRTAELPTRLSDGGLGEDLYREVPFIRKIIGSVSEREDLGSYIEKRDVVMSAYDELKAAKDAGDAQRYAKARSKYADELKYLKIVRSIESQRRKISAQMNNVRDNVKLSDERKRELLDQLDKKKQLLIKLANQRLKEFK